MGEHDFSNPEVCDRVMPYDGPNLYPTWVVMQLLRDEVIVPEDCLWGIECTRSVDPKVLKKSATLLQDCVTEAAEQHISLLLMTPHNIPDW